MEILKKIEILKEKYLNKKKNNFEQNKKVVINLVGGSGVGKTTTSILLVSYLYFLGLKTDLIQESAKRYIITEQSKMLDDQYKITKEQYLLLKFSPLEKIPVFDNSLLISRFYNYYNKNNINNKEVNDKIFENWYNEFDNIVFYLLRNENIPYTKNGKTEDYPEAKLIDEKMLDYVTKIEKNIVIVPREMDSSEKAFFILEKFLEKIFLKKKMNQ